MLVFLLGQYALHRLLAVREEDVVPRRVLLLELRQEVLRGFRPVATAAGLLLRTAFPYILLGERRRAPTSKSTPDPDPLVDADSTD